MIISSYKQVGYLKRRPASHKLEGITTTQHPGMVISSYPKPYPMNAPQKKVRDAARACNIKKGMSRSSLVDAMINCVPGKF